MKYFFPEYEDEEDAREYEEISRTKAEHDAFTAESVAERYYNLNRGDNSSPMKVILFDEKERSEWTVDVDWDPVFTAHRVKA